MPFRERPVPLRQSLVRFDVMRKHLAPVMLIAVLFGAEAIFAAPILQPTDFIIAIDSNPNISFSNSPGQEGPANAIDGIIGTKYLNFGGGRNGEAQTGLIVTPFLGATTVQSMRITTANDHSSRDPATWELWGTNDAINHAEANHGTSIIPGVNWSLIASGDANLPGSLPGGGEFLPSPPNPPNTPNPANDGRLMEGPLYSFSNATAYSSYRIVFPTVKDPAAANSMQIAEVQLYPDMEGLGGGVLSLLDEVSAIQLPQPLTPLLENAAQALDGTAPRLDLPALSSSPANEGPANVVDGTTAKYLNSGGDLSGFIVTPAVGPSTVRSFQIMTANDAVPRDPASYQLFGTNDPIMSLNNSYGTAENWTLISEGALPLPTDRNTLGPVISVANEASFTSYKMLFPTRVNDPATGLMQIAEASFYSTSDGTGPDILNPGDVVLAVDATIRTGLETKYLSFGEENSGVIVTPGVGAKVVTSLQITTANDAPERDPASFEIYGTNDPITSTEDSTGTAENWTLIASGALNLPDARMTAGEIVTFANNTAYTSYKIVFPTVKDAEVANSLQFAGLQLFDDSAAANPDFDGDGDVDGRDFLVWQRGFGQTGQTSNANGDADGNGTVDVQDLAAWRAQFGSGGGAVGAVPEPASMFMAMGALVLLATAARQANGRS